MNLCKLFLINKLHQSRLLIVKTPLDMNFSIKIVCITSVSLRSLDHDVPIRNRCRLPGGYVVLDISLMPTQGSQVADVVGVGVKTIYKYLPAS